jgi:uncharacterized protein (TIGR02001 family)
MLMKRRSRPLSCLSINEHKEIVMSAPFGLRSAAAALAATALFSGAALAQTTPAPAAAPAKEEPDYTLTGNVGLFSQYVFRGISQTNEKPAVQGGFDWAHKSGVYLGTWASNISWVSDGTSGNPSGFTASAPIEWDFYGGYKGSLPADFGYDIGVLYYWYPGTYPPGYVVPNTTESYGALTWKSASLKYSWSGDHSLVPARSPSVRPKSAFVPAPAPGT